MISVSFAWVSSSVRGAGEGGADRQHQGAGTGRSRAATKGHELRNHVRRGEQNAPGHGSVADLRGGDGGQGNVTGRSVEKRLVDDLLECRRVGLKHVVAVLDLRLRQGGAGGLVINGDFDDVRRDRGGDDLADGAIQPPSARKLKGKSGG